MRTGRRERGVWRARLRSRFAVVVSLCVILAALCQSGPQGTEFSNANWAPVASALLVSPASADGSRKHRPAGMVALGQRAAKQKNLPQQAPAPTNVRHLQQVQAVQQRVQQIQQMVAAQHKVVQQILQIQAARTGPQHQSSLQPAGALQGSHQARFQNGIAKLKSHQHNAAQNGGPPGGGQHHKALLQAVAAKAARQHTHVAAHNTLGHKANGQHQSRQQTAFQQVLAKLKGHHGGHSLGGQHQVRQHAVFRHIMAKLSRYRHGQKQQTTETAATPAPSSSSHKAANGTLVSTLPAVGQALPSTSLITSQLGGNGGGGQSGSSGEGGGLGGGMGLGGPKQAKQASESEVGNSRGGKKIDDNERPTRPVLGRPARGAPLPLIGSFKANEVLAVNLTAAGLNAAMANNYVLLGYTDLPAFGFKITRLQPPEGENAVNGLHALYDLVPDAGFTLNRVYAPYRMGLGVGAAVKSGMGCAADRCFGPGLIKWQPELAACARKVTIGIIDTGYDKSHPAFQGMRHKYELFVPPNAKFVPQHGTAVLSLLAGNPDSTTPGLIPNADYRIANAFYADSNGQATSDTTHILAALHWLKKEGVAVANLSFSGPEDELIQVAVQKLTAAGVVVVAAAGNDGPSAPPSYPAAYKEVIAVTAVDRNRAPYPYANRGPYIDVAAPGVGIWTALPGKREGAQTGTSFAVPYVTAVIAVNYPEGLGPSNDPSAAKQLAMASIRKNIQGLKGHGLGAGLVQARDTCGAQPGGQPGVAGSAPKTAEARAGVVQPGESKEAPALGPWVSTVHAVSGKETQR